MYMNKKYSQGVTLVEMMVAMVIGLILMGGVTLIMISSQRTYTVQGDMARLQENARFALDFLTRDLRSAGYFGCSGAQPVGTVAIGSFDNQTRENTGPNNSDSIDISFFETGPSAFAVVDPNPAQAAPLEVGTTDFDATNPGAINAGDEVGASDCGGTGPLIQVQAVNGNSITTDTGLTRTYNNQGQIAGAELRRMAKYRYRIAAMDIDGNQTAAANPYTFSLVRDVIGTADNNFNVRSTQELAQGVETMQVRYSVDMNGDGIPDRYLNYDQIVADPNINFNNVFGVRVALLMRTIDDRVTGANTSFLLDADNNSYELEPGQAAYGPMNDFRLRRVFTTVVRLRNVNGAS